MDERTCQLIALTKTALGQMATLQYHELAASASTRISG